MSRGDRLPELNLRPLLVEDMGKGRPTRGLQNRLMRELGPLNPNAPAFPLASAPLSALRAHAEAHGSGEFSLFSVGQAVPLARAVSAAEVVIGFQDCCSDSLALCGL